MIYCSKVGWAWPYTRPTPGYATDSMQLAVKLPSNIRDAKVGPPPPKLVQIIGLVTPLINANYKIQISNKRIQVGWPKCRSIIFSTSQKQCMQILAFGKALQLMFSNHSSNTDWYSVTYGYTAAAEQVVHWHTALPNNITAPSKKTSSSVPSSCRLLSISRKIWNYNMEDLSANIKLLKNNRVTLFPFHIKY